MNMVDIKERYHHAIVEHMLDVLYDTPVHDLVEEVLYRMNQKELDKWAKLIQDDNELADLYNQNKGSISV